MGCDDIRRCRSGRALDEEEVAADIRNGGVAAGVGNGVGDRHSKNADTTAIQEQVARPVIHRRTERDSRTVGRQADTPTCEIVVCFTVVVRAALDPRSRSGVVVIDADVASVGTGCSGVVVGRTHRERIAGGGETETVSALIAAGDDFVGGVFGPGEAVVAGEVDESGIPNSRGLVLTGRRYRHRIPIPIAITWCPVFSEVR